MADSGRDLTAQDVVDAIDEWTISEVHHHKIAEHLNRIARPSPRSWSLPAPPPDDVTVEYRVTVTRSDGAVLTTYAGDDRYVAERMAGSDGCRAEERTVSPWRELSVMEGEPPAPEPQEPLRDTVTVLRELLDALEADQRRERHPAGMGRAAGIGTSMDRVRAALADAGAVRVEEERDV